MASDNEQKSVEVPQHKRIAQGEKLDGTSYQPKGGSTDSKPKGGLSHIVHKKNK
jgi:hypothetical protein